MVTLNPLPSNWHPISSSSLAKIKEATKNTNHKIGSNVNMSSVRNAPKSLRDYKISGSGGSRRASLSNVSIGSNGGIGSRSFGSMIDQESMKQALQDNKINRLKADAMRGYTTDLYNTSFWEKFGFGVSGNEKNIKDSLNTQSYYENIIRETQLIDPLQNQAFDLGIPNSNLSNSNPLSNLFTTPTSKTLLIAVAIIGGLFLFKK